MPSRRSITQLAVSEARIATKGLGDTKPAVPHTARFFIRVATVLVIAPIGRVLAVGAQAVDSTTLRPTDVIVTVGNDPQYDGTYRARGTSRICGKLDLMMPHRANSFNVEFPDDEPKYGEPGTAVRIKVASRDTLRLNGTATTGTKVIIQMVVICHPKP